MLLDSNFVNNNTEDAFLRYRLFRASGLIYGVSYSGINFCEAYFYFSHSGVGSSGEPELHLNLRTGPTGKFCSFSCFSKKELPIRCCRS